ncbi:MAG: hypothetical protein O2972_09330 [Cyanobacteria bacterium]|jgi:hypothetical protein|nr:hypothetical protein [Synechococcus sp. BS307-5m-G38]MDA0258876.1 hypothetical protein [Cyanobacteriota bacterium]
MNTVSVLSLRPSNKSKTSAQKLPQLKPRPVYNPPNRPRKQLNQSSWDEFRYEYSGLS